MLLGKRVLGVEGAKAEKEKYGGTIVPVRLGPRVLRPMAAAAAPAVSTPVRPARASGNRLVKEPKATKTTKKGAAAPAVEVPAQVSYSEEEIEAMLAEDANVWDVIVDAESARPEGPRAAVASMILAAADRATVKPIPAEILEVLEGMATPQVTK